MPTIGLFGYRLFPGSLSFLVFPTGLVGKLCLLGMDHGIPDTTKAVIETSPDSPASE